MTWGQRYPLDGDRRIRFPFAWFPIRTGLGRWVWLERYVEDQRFLVGVKTWVTTGSWPLR